MNQTKPTLPSRYKLVTKRQTTENLVCFVYAFEGVGLYFEPYLYSEEIAHIPFAEKITLMSSDYEVSFRYKWYKADYQGNTVYVSEKWIGIFPPPNKEETIEEYAEKLDDLGFDIDVENYVWDDRQEFKLLLVSNNMRAVFTIACLLYPIDFKFPKSSNKIEEILTKIDDKEDIYEEFEVTRNKNGEVIMIDYIADFGESSDSVTLRMRSDGKIMLTFGSYGQHQKVIPSYL
ncbi:MAG: hypothetical protein ACJAUH_001185 [Saprospiraceae bacterium]|jgi:hypothetical protein|tara:strand:+ start:112 stop:807 length:696 start_codon:yes stop_codon:yes gene_type:complete